MRCKKHLTDFTSSVGVCASCLRERLFSLIAAQAQAQSQARAAALLQEDSRKSDTNPPPLVFPRSVSPYICRAKSDNSVPKLHHNFSGQIFYGTPQVGPTGAVGAGKSYKKKKSRFSLLSRLFGSKSKNTDFHPSVSDSNSRNSRTTSASASASSSLSPSWFSVMISRQQKKQSRLFSLDEPASGLGRRTVANLDRGMSPARVSDDGDEEEFYDGSSGYSSESSQGWRRTPQRAAPPVRRGVARPNHPRNLSGLTFCLSPLVRASPNRHWIQKGMPPEMAFPGETRIPGKPPLSTAAAFCANRSRKLADFGRFSQHR